MPLHIRYNDFIVCKRALNKIHYDEHFQVRKARIDYYYSKMQKTLIDAARDKFKRQAINKV